MKRRKYRKALIVSTMILLFSDAPDRFADRVRAVLRHCPEHISDLNAANYSQLSEQQRFVLGHLLFQDYWLLPPYLQKYGDKENLHAITPRCITSRKANTDWWKEVSLDLESRFSWKVFNAQRPYSIVPHGSWISKPRRKTEPIIWKPWPNWDRFNPPDEEY
jgi:hypothetical protein